MPITNKQEEENQSGSNGLAAKLEQAGLDAEAGQHSKEKEKPGGGISHSPKKRPVFRWALLLLAIGLVSAGYVYREKLLRLVSKDTAQHKQTTERKVLYWVDPMNPAYKSDKPGKALDGMDLVPVYAEETSTIKANLPEGAFQITPEKQQLIGVQYGTAEFKTVNRTLRAVGRLTFDETKIVRIHPRVEGWIEQVSVDFTGKLVQRGQPLLSIYSPDLLQTQQEFLLARRGRDELADSPFREAVTGSASLYEAARKRLELWDVSEAQIRELERSGKPTKTLTINAPTSGFVLTRNAFAKQRVTPETELYTIADLSTIWVIADVYESEAPEIKLGQAATFTLSYSPGRTFRGRVSNIAPQLDSATRTLKVRIEVPNPGFLLKPDMFANVELQIGYGKQVVVPQEAVMDSGAEQMVFVGIEGGYFEPRKVQLGAKVDNEFIVLSGLKAGERVVTSANFLVDSESKLKSAAGGMGMPGMSHGGGEKKALPKESQSAPPVDHSQHQPGATVTPQSKPEDHSQHQPKKQE